MNKPYFFKNDWYFRHAFTLDPAKVGSAWDLLDTDHSHVEMAELPKTLHRALIGTLRERKTFDRLSRGKTPRR